MFVISKNISYIKFSGFRRCALKDGFEQLLKSLPNLYGCGTKPTNAIVLTRAAERIRQLKAEIALDEEKTRQLKRNIQRLNDKISLVFFISMFDQNKSQLRTQDFLQKITYSDVSFFNLI